MRSLVLLCLTVSLADAADPADPPSRWRPNLMMQTGFASTFQLTLGGTFGAGPAWQNRLIAEWPHRFRKGDALMLNIWSTLDSPSRNADTTIGVSYRFPEWTRGRQALSITAGWQRWIFPSVLGGTRDHLAATTVVYRTRWKVPITVTADDWALLRSNLKRGNLLYMQASAAHVLYRHDKARLILRHGPASTYSWSFYDRPAWRVFRYGGGLSLEGAKWALEGSLRRQSAIAPRVPDNRYWLVLLTRRF